VLAFSVKSVQVPWGKWLCCLVEFKLLASRQGATLLYVIYVINPLHLAFGQPASPLFNHWGADPFQRSAFKRDKNEAKSEYLSIKQQQNSPRQLHALVHCPLRSTPVSGQPQTIWKYNAMYHLIQEHSIGDTPPPAVVDSDFYH